MDNNLEIRISELEENPTPRVPVCMALDVSYSMVNEPIAELNNGVKAFFNALMEDEIAHYSADIAMVTFGNDINVELDFLNIQKQQIPHLSVSGATPMGKGINKALELLELRKAEYKTVGIEYWQPWLVIMTDGQPTDDTSEAEKRIQTLVANKKLTVIPIGIGKRADMKTLARFSPYRTPLKLKGLQFNTFFQWLSMSVAKASVSTANIDSGLSVNKEDISLWADNILNQDIKGWDSL
ncbi:Tellurite resistance, TerY [Candidatus Magnetomorum sp. HK-1]|nr:Tellurite resistance, TerY [Candidatus Magnetomorum sp. HK-1]